jgi:hypothetical protein
MAKLVTSEASFDKDPAPRAQRQVCPPVEDFSTWNDASGHQEKLEIHDHFSALARGRDIYGQRFEAETVLVGLSSSRVTLCLPRPVELGSRLFVVSHVANAHIAMLVVARILELDVEGCYEMTAAIKRYRFLRSADAVEDCSAT